MCTIFFLSDIHLSHEKAENQGLVIDAFLDDFRKQKQQLNPHECFVLIGGDLVKDADAEGAYQVFYDRIVRPIMATGIKKRNIVCIPGNHDAQREWIRKNQFVYGPVINQSFTEDTFNTLINNKESADLLIQKFFNFSEFMVEKMECVNYNLIAKYMSSQDDDGETYNPFAALLKK